MSNIKNKKDKKHGWYFKIKRRMPDAYVAANKRWEPYLDYFRQSEKKFRFEGTSLIVEGDKVKPDLVPPKVNELINLSPEHERILSAKHKYHGAEAHIVKGSSFFSYCFPIAKKGDVEEAYMWTRLNHLEATHVSCRARIITSPGRYLEIGCDDGETQAEIKIQEAITQNRLANVAVFVVRYYGGVHLNRDRLPTIYHVANKACDTMLNCCDKNDLLNHRVPEDSDTAKKGKKTKDASSNPSKGASPPPSDVEKDDETQEETEDVGEPEVENDPEITLGRRPPGKDEDDVDTDGSVETEVWQSAQKEPQQPRQHVKNKAHRNLDLDFTV